MKDIFLRRCSKNVELWITRHRGNISFCHSKINQRVGSSESVIIKVFFLGLHLPIALTYSLAFSVLWITHLNNMRAYKALIQLHVHQPFTQIHGKNKSQEILSLGLRLSQQWRMEKSVPAQPSVWGRVCIRAVLRDAPCGQTQFLTLSQSSSPLLCCVLILVSPNTSVLHGQAPFARPHATPRSSVSSQAVQFHTGESQEQPLFVWLKSLHS